MDIKKRINQPEGRILEFKEHLPSTTDVAKTMVAFANDAGGEFFVGVKNNPRTITGIPPNKLDSVENQISNLINDLCEPVIQPEITYLDIEGKKVIRVYIHRGFKPPYYIKSKGKENGTFIRVGSSNRMASSEIIAELERQSKNISFDAEVVFGQNYEELDLKEFSELYFEKTKEQINKQVLKKLDLVREQQGTLMPTYALVLVSSSPLRKILFPYAKIECARFKGTKPGTYIDNKTIDCNISGQAEEAYQFVMRHVNRGTVDYTGVYHNQRWEYPMIALREVIRNAVIHRDYSLTGKDIKIAIFDDKIEISSPGKLMPTVDYSLMDAGQSDVRNKVLAPVFKKLGIIEQWGNGLQLIADDLELYPEIQLEWKEPGIAFRVSFLKKEYKEQLQLKLQLKSQLELQLESQLKSQLKSQLELQPELQLELQQELKEITLYGKVLKLLYKDVLSKKKLSEALGQKKISGQLNKVAQKLVNDELISLTEKELTSSKQQYKITGKGIAFIKLLEGKKK